MCVWILRFPDYFERLESSKPKTKNSKISSTSAFAPDYVPPLALLFSSPL